MSEDWNKERIKCPHCQVEKMMKKGSFSQNELKGEHYYVYQICYGCEREIIWQLNSSKTIGNIIYPKQKATSPTKDMPEKIKEIYEEASLVLGDSPRASCALLRLALQELMIYLRDNYQEYSDLKGKKIDDDIGILVKNHNLSAKIQQALDVVRIAGNNAVHPKELDINDNPEIAEKLFKMINLIIEEMITKPKEVEELFQEMPQGAKDAISKRDQ